MSIPTMMRAAQILEKGGPYVVHEVPVPEVGPWEILIKTACAGHCHTDTMVADGAFGGAFPITGSHEPAGTVAKMRKAQIQGECWDCKEGSKKYCSEFKGALGIMTDGAFADYTLVDARSAVALPDSMAWDQAAPLMCAGVTCFSAIKKAGMLPGATIGIIGLGALGHLGVQMAKAMGYIVVGVDARPEPIALTKSLALAPDLCLNAATTSVEDALAQITALDPTKPLRGLDACIVVNDVPASFEYAVDILARHGTFVLVGQPEHGVNFSFKDLIFKDIKVVGSLIGDTAQAQATVDLAAKYNIEVKTSKYRLDDMAQLLEDAHAPGRKGKSVVMF